MFHLLESDSLTLVKLTANQFCKSLKWSLFVLNSVTTSSEREKILANGSRLYKALGFLVLQMSIGDRYFVKYSVDWISFEMLIDWLLTFHFSRAERYHGKEEETYSLSIMLQYKEFT